MLAYTVFMNGLHGGTTGLYTLSTGLALYPVTSINHDLLKQIARS